MSLVNLPENFLYERLPAGLIALDERALIQAVVGGYQDRLEDVRSYAKKFQLFFSSTGLPETGPNVVLVDYTTSAGRVITRSLDVTTDTPTNSSTLLTWAAAQLDVDISTLANARFGVDLLRLVDANILDYLATNIGAVLYNSAVAELQPNTVTSSGTFTAQQQANQQLIATYFPRLKFKGTARSFDALGKLLGFDDVRMVPLWGRVSPHLPTDPGSSINDPDFSEVPEFYPKQDLDPFYDPLSQRDGVFYTWYGTVANGTSAPNYWTQVINGFQPWVKFEADLTNISRGTLTLAAGGTYTVEGGAAHAKARVTVPNAGTFVALGEGESWNGITVGVTELDGTLRRIDITDQLSAVKYRTSFYNLGITMDADKAEALFGTLSMRANKDLLAAPHAYVSWSGTLYGTSPYRPFTGGTAAFQATDGVNSTDFITPFAGTVVYYRERTEATLHDGQENFADLAKAGQGVTQALEEVRAATRMPRRASYGYLQDDSVKYAPIPAEECVLVVPAYSTASGQGTFTHPPLEPYTTGASFEAGTVYYATDNTTDNRYPARVEHFVGGDAGTLTGFTVPTAGSYNLTAVNQTSQDGTVCVQFYGTYGDWPFNTHEVVRPEPFNGTQVLAIIGDYGLASNFAPGQPAARVATLVHGWKPEVIITTGDNNYYGGAASTIAANNLGYLDYIQQGRMYPALGNHDLQSDSGEIQANFFFNGTVPGPAGGRYYNVRRGNVEWFVLNSGWDSAMASAARGLTSYAPTKEPDGNTYDSVQGQWLKAALARSTAQWKLLFVHQPPYASDTNSHVAYPGYPILRWPFREWGATAMFSGHVHNYERLIVDDFPYFIMGISGEFNGLYTGSNIYPGSVVRYAQSPGPTNYGAIRVVATNEFIRFEARNANPTLPPIDTYQINASDRRYMDRPEDELDDTLQFETLDEYPYRRDILVGGELVETNFYTSGTAVEQYAILEQTMAVKDQTQVDFDVFVEIGQHDIPQFVIRPRPLPYKPGQRAICFTGQFRNQSLLGPDDLDVTTVTGGRSQYFHSDLDNVFQPGYQLYHAGLVNGVLVADADKFCGEHHLRGLCGWLPFDEHPEAPLAVRDAVMSQAYQSMVGFAPQDRAWDNQHGFSLQFRPGARVTASATRLAGDDFTISFWAKTPLAGGVTMAEPVVQFGNLRFMMVWSTPPLIHAEVYREDVGWFDIGFGYYFTPGMWQFIYARKQGDQVWLGFGNLGSFSAEQFLDVGVLGTHIPSNAGCDTLLIGNLTQGPLSIRDLRIWNVCKTQAELTLVKNHLPQATVVPYRVGHVLSINSGDRYGLRVLPNGWLTPSNLPAWVRSPKFAKVIRYESEGEYKGEAYRKEVGLGGGQILPTPWRLGEQYYSMTANGTVAVSPQLGAMPGSNAYWQGDATGAPGYYIVLNGSVSSGTTAVVTASGSGANPWPNRMEATNPVRESIWIADSGGTALYEAKLQAVANAMPQFVTTLTYDSNQQQGDAAIFLAVPGTKLAVTNYGSVVQEAYAGTVTTPPLFMYMNETLLESASGANAYQRWTDPSAFGAQVGAPALKENGEISFTNNSVLRAGTYKLKVDLGNYGKPDDEFDGFRLDITLADTTYSETLLSGYSGNNLRGQPELTLIFDHDISGDWLLTFNWLNAYSDPSRGVARRLVIYGYELRRLETSLYRVDIAPTGTLPVLAQISAGSTVFNQGTYWSDQPGGWLVEINSFGTVSQVAHESDVYPDNDTLRSRYPLANLLTGLTEQRREDIISAGTFCLFDDPDIPFEIVELPKIVGQVTDSLTLAPIVGATVLVVDSGGMTHVATTDGSGNYTVENIPTGSATGTASKTSYVTGSNSVTVVPGINTLNIALVPYPSLSGHVTNSITSSPIWAATVQVTDSAATVYTVLTDLNGYYHIPVLAPGSATINVTKSSYTPYSAGTSFSPGPNVIDVALTPSAVMVSVSVSPPGAATTTGGGSYAPGSSVTLTAFPAIKGYNQGYVDVVFMIDESASMSAEHAWLSTVPAQLEAALQAAGIGTGPSANQYALVGFASSTHGSGQRAHKHLVNSGDWGTAAQLQAAASGLSLNGGTEDGYDAISFALANYTYRGGAVKMFILVTDEDRDTLSTDTYSSILTLMNTNNVIFATINDYTITDNLAAQCIGSDSVTLGSLVYKANGTGGYIHTTTLSALSGFGTTVADYANLAIARGGTYWNLNILRNGGNDALSFTAAFTTIVKDQILYAVSWVFSYWDIGGVLYYTNPATFVVNADTSAVVYLV